MKESSWKLGEGQVRGAAKALKRAAEFQQWEAMDIFQLGGGVTER